MNPVPVGLDDGYAFTKVALPDGRLIAIPSRARVGQSEVTWINGAEQRIFEYQTEDAVYSVGAVDGAPTHFDGYPWSGLNRAIVQHALQQAGLAGRTIHAVSGLPVSTFYRTGGEHRQETIARKRDSLKQVTQPMSNALPAGIAFHEVIPEALAAWYDHVIVEADEGVTLDADRVSVPIAIVDIGGRTTDYVVVKDQGILHASSGSLQCGMLNVKQGVSNGIQARFDLESLSEQLVSQAVEKGVVRLHGKDHDVADLVGAAKREVVERIHAETRRQLGLGVELDRVLFVGGGTVALAEHIADWFPHQAIAEHPAFANARGMLKYLRYVCEASDAA
ncbi:MAG: ParM/StbA family protein [Candidatus Thiodiazotropha sp. (ex Ctena orbiculata)]|uniref:ParM/StbA family protein n=1 Tax=Candidatus Thiodiazotropha taylori TaxID=2792791 RepID=A0A944QUG5_9GAMM|nr:ParM/StbA family protein [Candidatus Thiodiazotropha taylori]